MVWRGSGRGCLPTVEKGHENREPKIPFQLRFTSECPFWTHTCLRICLCLESVQKSSMYLYQPILKTPTRYNQLCRRQRLLQMPHMCGKGRAQRQHKTLQQRKQFEQQNEDKKERTEGTLTKRAKHRRHIVVFCFSSICKKLQTPKTHRLQQLSGRLAQGRSQHQQELVIDSDAVEHSVMKSHKEACSFKHCDSIHPRASVRLDTSQGIRAQKMVKRSA